MFNPEIDINNISVIKALLIYEEYKKSKEEYISENVLKRMLKSGVFYSAAEYFDCICVFYAFGMLKDDNGNMRFSNHETD